MIFALCILIKLNVFALNIVPMLDIGQQVYFYLVSVRQMSYQLVNVAPF